MEHYIILTGMTRERVHAESQSSVKTAIFSWPYPCITAPAGGTFAASLSMGELMNTLINMVSRLGQTKLIMGVGVVAALLITALYMTN